MKCKAQAAWRGTGRDGDGDLSTDSGILKETPYSYRTRFENQPGTNPEELIAAAHAGCFTMAPLGPGLLPGGQGLFADPASSDRGGAPCSTRTGCRFQDHQVGA